MGCVADPTRNSGVGDRRHACASSRRSQLVQGGAASGNPETDRPFDDSLAPGAESHVFLARAARPVASDEAFDRVGAAPLKFQQAVEELLHLTRPFSFC